MKKKKVSKTLKSIIIKILPFGDKMLILVYFYKFVMQGVWPSMYRQKEYKLGQVQNVYAWGQVET